LQGGRDKKGRGGGGGVAMGMSAGAAHKRKHTQNGVTLRILRTANRKLRARTQTTRKCTQA